MRETYPEYFDRSDEELKRFATEATIVLDTNVLLSLYRLAPDARENTLSVLESAGVADRLWIPYRVGMEFLRNRERVLSELGAAYRRALEAVDKLPKAALEGFGSGKRYEASREAVKRAINAAVEQLRAQLERIEDADPAHIDADDDPIFDRIQMLVHGRIGSPPSGRVARERIETFLEYRVPNLIPPGFKDDAKDGADRAGDYLLWCEILDLATETQRPVLFVTEDGKEDWFEGPRGQKTGPRRELVREFAEHSPHGYHQVGLDRFLALARTYLRLDVDEETIAEVVEEAAERRRLEVDPRVLEAAISGLTLNQAALQDALRQISLTQAAELQGTLRQINPGIQEALRRAYQPQLAGIQEALRRAYQPQVAAFQDALRQISLTQMAGLQEALRRIDLFPRTTRRRGRDEGSEIASPPEGGDHDAADESSLNDRNDESDGEDPV